MKSFFKKVALLLVLAMVVTMLPAKAASAALDDDGLYMRSKLTLYLGGDASGDIGDFGYATVKYDKDTYTSVRFVSSNPEVAEVGSRKGGVTALAVGEATVTATFTAADGTTQTRDCKVVVKQNAAEVWVSEKGVAKLAGLTVGDEPFQLVVGRKTADGTEAWNQKGAITDGIRFASSNEEVIKVGPTKGGVEVVGAGEATLYVWAVEGQKQNGGVDEGNPYITECKDGQIAEDDPCYGYYKYLRTTEVKAYEVVVVAKEITAEQTTHKAFKVIFPTDAEAKAAADKTAESLSKASAAVTEDTDIINVYEVLKNTGVAEEKASRMIGDVSVDGNVVVVTMFDEVEQETNYVITYQEKSVTVLTAKNVAVDMSIERKVEARTETSSNISIDYRLFTTGSNGQPVDITWCKAYGEGDWKASVELEDLSTEAYHSDYLFTKLANGGMIYFYTVDASNVVNLKATFEDWSQLIENKPYTIVKTLTVTAADSNVENVKLAGYAVTKDEDIQHNDKVNEAIDKFAGAKKEFAASDPGYRLIVYATRSVNGVVEGICSADDNRFTFVSANEDKLIVNKDNGDLYPAKEPRNDNVSVYVYYDGEYIGACSIRIWAERKLTSFTAELKSNTLSYNPEFGVDEEVELELKPLDQLGDTYTDDISFSAEVYMDSEAKYLDVVGSGLKWIITGTNELKERTIYSIRILCKATYTDDNGSEKEMRYVVTLRVKNTHDETERRYEIVPTGKYDLAVKDEDGLRINEKHITLAAYSYDRDGFKVKHLSLASAQAENEAGTATSDNTLVILIGNKPVPADQIVVTGNGEITDVQLVTATVTASGSSEQIIHKIETGTYVARLFVGNGSRAVYKTSCTINLTDSQGSIGWKWVKFSTNMGVANDDDVAKAIVDCFDFGDNKNSIYVIGAEDDYVLKGNRLTVKRVRCNLPIDIGGQRYYYEIVTDINRTISVDN